MCGYGLTKAAFLLGEAQHCNLEWRHASIRSSASRVRCSIIYSWAAWHVVLFKEFYKQLAIYSNIEHPRFSFGMLAMLLQGTVFAYLYPLIQNKWVFGVGMLLLLVSFMVFAEAGKQKTTSLSGFVCIQLAFSAIQALVVSTAFAFVA